MRKVASTRANSRIPVLGQSIVCNCNCNFSTIEAHLEVPNNSLNVSALSKSNWYKCIGSVIFGNVFEERRKPEFLVKNPSEQRREQTTNLTHIWRRRRDMNPGQIDGRRVLPPLRHAYFPSNVTNLSSLKVMTI